MQRIAERLNRSRKLGGIISFLSGYLANYRGVPIFAGIIAVILSLLLQLLGTFLELRALSIAGMITLHLGLLIALVGVLLAEPLGKG